MKGTAPVAIKEIRSGELQAYREFLNHGLIHDEESFRITPADDSGSPFPTRDSEDSFTLGAYIGNRLAGVVSFEREGINREKLRHKGILFRMYVSAEHRGQGMARLLMEKVMERAQAVPGIEQVNLTVIANNAHAKNLYEKLGFKTFSHEERAIKWKEKYFDEDQMVLPLHR